MTDIPSGFPEERLYVRRWLWIALVVVLILVLAGCRTDTPEDPGSSSPAGLAQEWDGIPAGAQEQVCAAAQERPGASAVDTGSGQIPQEGPDWQGMLEVLVFNGMQREDAAALLPYAANRCV